jgi:hypothetical protein
MTEHYIRAIYVTSIPKEATTRSNTKMVISKRLPKKKLIECFTNQTRRPWQEHYQQLDSTESMINTVKQYQGCQLHHSNGFGKAVAILDYMGGKEDAFIPEHRQTRIQVQS